MDALIDAIFVSSVNLGKACLHVYDAGTGSCTKSFRGFSAAPKSLCLAGSDDYIICGQKDKPLLQAWLINQNEALQMRLSVPGKLNVMAVSQSGDHLCAVGIGEKIYIYHMNTGCLFGLINRHYQAVTCLKFTSCGNYLASAGEDGFVYLWSKFKLLESLHKFDKPQISPHYILGQHSDKVTGLCISEPGMRGILVTTSLDHSAKVFDLVTGHLRHNIIADCGLSSCVMNSIGSQVFLGGVKGKVWGVNLLPHNPNQDLQLEEKGNVCHSSDIQHLALTSSGDVLVTGGVDGEVKLWSIVISDRKNVFSSPSLAFQQSLLIGRGAITNLLILKLDAEIFNLSTLRPSAALSPFNTENKILDTPISFVTRPKEENDLDTKEILSCAAELFSLNKASENLLTGVRNASTRKAQKKVTKLKNLQNSGISETDLLAHVQKLKGSNKAVYKYCANFFGNK